MVRAGSFKVERKLRPRSQLQLRCVFDSVVQTAGRILVTALLTHSNLDFHILYAT